jgi:type II secretory pathway pseudopilin PulG
MFKQGEGGGFTLANLIVTIGVLALLLASVFFLINPGAKMGEAANEKRRQDILMIAQAIDSYARDHHGALPILGAVSATAKKVLCATQTGIPLTCGVDSQNCLAIDDQNFYDKYLRDLPHDPNKTSNADTGYYLFKNSNDLLEVGACSPYNSVGVSYTSRTKVTCQAYAGGYCWYDGSTIISFNCNDVCANYNLLCPSNVNLAGHDDTSCELNKPFTPDDTCDYWCTATSNLLPPGWANEPDTDPASYCSYKKAQVFICSNTNTIYNNLCPCY